MTTPSQSEPPSSAPADLAEPAEPADLVDPLLPASHGPSAEGRGSGPRVELTPEQRAIVGHDHGPAVVFAVAGSGKTTAMVHRIERLVREGVFEPTRILATSFSRATVADLEHALAHWPHCQEVEVRTIHSLARRILQRASQLGATTRSGSPIQLANPGADVGMGQLPQRILSLAQAIERKSGRSHADEVDDVDRRDFLRYVSECKGNLRYARLRALELPDEAMAHASQADPPPGHAWYLDLYRTYEQVRQDEGWTTYDDLLVQAWECLVRYPGLREQVQAWFDCVVVDEFQDVNLAQHLIMDTVARPSLDYMVVGDDDQTIYEWRGARPEFILDFEDTYEATTYRIQDNFRCKAPHIALANRIIAHNQQRIPKRLSLTQGFDGELDLARHESESELGRAVVGQVQAYLAEDHAEQAGRSLSDITILLRLYAQSAYIEHHLIAQGIPYDITGSVPFYERGEVTALTAYAELARIEAALAIGEPLSPGQKRALPRLLTRVANKADPPRYIPHAVARETAQLVLATRTPISRATRQNGRQSKAWIARGLERLGKDIAWLSRQLGKPNPAKVLEKFDKRIGYREHLRNASGFEETGEGRARNVTALIDYAENANNLEHLLRQLANLKIAHEATKDTGERLDLRTIHRAKGLEWPVVILPHVNEGTLPFARSFQDPSKLEEERRLLYVALTRTKRAAHLHALEDTKLSRFLEEADLEGTLEAVAEAKGLLGKDPADWTQREAVTATRHVHGQGSGLGLERYVERWWGVDKEQREAAQAQMAEVVAKAEAEGVLEALLQPSTAKTQGARRGAEPEGTADGGCGVGRGSKGSPQGHKAGRQGRNPDIDEEKDAGGTDGDKAYDVEAIRETHAQAYAPWTEEKDAELLGRVEAGESTAEIAAAMGRTAGAIRSRVRKVAG